MSERGRDPACGDDVESLPKPRHKEEKKRHPPPWEGDWWDMAGCWRPSIKPASSVVFSRNTVWGLVVKRLLLENTRVGAPFLWR